MDGLIQTRHPSDAVDDKLLCSLGLEIESSWSHRRGMSSCMRGRGSCGPVRPCCCCCCCCCCHGDCIGTWEYSLPPLIPAGPKPVSNEYLVRFGSPVSVIDGSSVVRGDTDSECLADLDRSNGTRLWCGGNSSCSNVGVDGDVLPWPPPRGLHHNVSARTKKKEKEKPGSRFCQRTPREYKNNRGKRETRRGDEGGRLKGRGGGLTRS